MFTTRLLSAAFAATLVLGASASAQQAKLTVIHAIPGLSAPVEVFANGGKLFSFDFKDSKGPLSLKPAIYKLEVKLKGTTVLSGNANVVAGGDYTVIAHLKEKSGIMLSVFENNQAPLVPGKSRLVVRHTANAPAVDVGLTSGGKNVGKLTKLSNPNQVTTEVPAGDYEATLFAAGTNTKAFGPAKLSVKAGTSYIVYAIGDLTGKTFGLFIQTVDVGIAPQLTVIHAIPGLAKPVDVFVDGGKLFSFDFKGSKGPLTLKPATYKLEVKLSGTTVLSANAKLETNKNYTVIAHLKEKSGIMLSIFDNDIKPLQPGKARLVVRHTAKAPTVDVALTSSGNTVGKLTKLSNPNQVALDVPAGNYEASLFAAGTTTKAFGPAKLSLSAGTSYIVYAIGDLSGKTFGLFVQTIGLDLEPALSTMISGKSCGGRIWVSNPAPKTDSNFDVILYGGSAAQPAFLNIGLSNKLFHGGGSLPIDGKAFGANGCFLYTSIDVIFTTKTNLDGEARFTVNVPSRFAGLVKNLYAQWWYPASGANPAGVRTTDYLTLTAK